MKGVVADKNYVGSVFYSAEDEVYFGKIEGIDGLVPFEGESVPQLKRLSMKRLKTILKLKKSSLNKPLGGFNVTIFD